MNQSHTSTERTTGGSPERFGYEWAAYSRILPESQGQLQRWLGTLPMESFRGKTVLDVGCGMGRNAYWIAQAEAESVLAVDVDERSIQAAQHNLAPLPNARVARRSVYDLNQADPGCFDRVVCIGVLHHLADPKDALTRMWDCVKEGGDLVLWCYGREGNRFVLPLIQSARWFGSRLPIRATHTLAGAIAIILWPAIRLFPWKTSYYASLKRLSFRNVESIIFDQMLPRIANYWRQEDMRELLNPLGGTVYLEFVQGNSWHARVNKPQKGAE